MNTTIVEWPIELHNARLASREAGDAFTGTERGGKLRPDRVGRDGRESGVLVQARGKPLWTLGPGLTNTPRRHRIAIGDRSSSISRGLSS